MKNAAAKAWGVSAWIFLSTPYASIAEETIYKIVDEHGRVTYSSTPPSETLKPQTLDLLPPPTEEEAREAQERVKQLDEATDKAEKERRERQQAQATSSPSVYIERQTFIPSPIVIDSLAPYRYPYYNPGTWHGPPYRPPGTHPDRPGTQPRPKPSPHPFPRR